MISNFCVNGLVRAQFSHTFEKLATTVLSLVLYICCRIVNVPLFLPPHRTEQEDRRRLQVADQQKRRKVLQLRQA